MYRVVIVDDEEPVLDSFAYILEKGSEEFTLCGTARSGSEAIRVASEVKPDVVFMDIQMPGIDGIDAISEIRRQYPEIVVILATAYERFDIAQRAIPLGVFSYLVKPISRRSFLGELDRVKEHLDRARERTAVQLEEIRLLQKTKEDIKDRLLGSLAWGNPEAEEWELFCRLFALGSERGSVRLAETPRAMPEVAREAIFAKFRESIQFKFNCVSTRVAGRLLLYFPQEQGMDRLDRYLERLRGEIGRDRLAIGAGGVCHYSDLSRSFSEALQGLEREERASSPRRSEHEEMQEIARVLLKSSFERGRSMVQDFSAGVFRRSPFEVAKAKMVALFTLLSSGTEGKGVASPPGNLNPAEEIMALESVDAWRYWLEGTLRAFEYRIKNRTAESMPAHLATALSIIHRDFGSPIQLSSVAEACRITPSYLCRLFSEHLGTSFVEYVTRYRIERATTLLTDEGRSIKETSALVGFQDPNYFSRIFRRYVGVSPSELTRTRR